MFRWYQKRLRILSASLAAAFAGIWLIGACAPALACQLPCGKESSSTAVPCERASAECEVPSLDAPLPLTLDFSITPIVLSTQPAIESGERVGQVPPVSWHVIRAPPTPLYITYLVLLN
jgi:hypothetical protein